MWSLFVVAILGSLNLFLADSSCSSFRSCISCTNTSSVLSLDCSWCGNLCVPKLSAVEVCPDSVIRFDDTCPVKHPPIVPALSDWMGVNMGAIGHLTLLDISLPGTHDTLTDDLSTIVSDGGIDDLVKAAQILHELEKIVPDAIEDFIRQQAQTHDLNIVEQLNNGIRFLDFRQMYEYNDTNPDWYSLHMVQSNSPTMKYFSAIRSWLDDHPSEIVVFWLSKHGSTCKKGYDQYPNTPIEAKRQHWAQIESLFADVITDFTVTQINTTTINEMIARNHRAVFYASDYEEFTNNSPRALDGCLIDNKLGPSEAKLEEAMEWERSNYKNAREIINQDKKQQGFFLFSRGPDVPSETTILAAVNRLHPMNDTLVSKCSSYFNLEGMHWCPPTLLDISQIQNYYTQVTLDEAVRTEGWSLPNAIYINAVDWYGTIRTGTRVLWGADRNPTDTAHATTGFAYVDTFILNNLQLGCASLLKDSSKLSSEALIQATSNCASLTTAVQQRRAKYPVTLWDDKVYGRQVSWEGK